MLAKLTCHLWPPVATKRFRPRQRRHRRQRRSLPSTTTGLLAETHGLDHEDRTILALLLTARWGRKLDPANERHCEAMENLAGCKVTWWTRYIGQIAHLLGTIYPTAFFDDSTPRVHLTATVSHMLGSKGRKTGLQLRIELQSDSPLTRPAHVSKLAHDIRKVGKKKNWVQGTERRSMLKLSRLDCTQIQC